MWLDFPLLLLELHLLGPRRGLFAVGAPTLLAIEATRCRGATMVEIGESNQEFPSFPIGRLTRKLITLKSARRHSYRSVELSRPQPASARSPLGPPPSSDT